MSIKKHIKKVIKNNFAADGVVGKAYRSAVNKKRENRYEKFADLPIDDKLVVFEAFMGRKYTDSPRAIYEYMLSHSEYDGYHFVWCFRDSVMESFAYVGDKDRTELVRWGSEEYYEIHAKAGAWVTNTRIPQAIGIRDGQKYVQTWHGTPLKRLGCDIETEATESKETTREVFLGDSKRYTHLISPSPFYTEKIASAFGITELGKEDVIVELGYPRNDSIFRGTVASESVSVESNESENDMASGAACETDSGVLSKETCVKELRGKLGIPDGKKVILYAPTYRENQRDENNKYEYREPLNLELMRKNLGENYVVLFRAHYYIAEAMNLSKFEDFVIDASEYPEINDLYNLADLLITDYSSVFFDFAITGKPIIFYMYDLEFYRDELRGFYLNIDDLPGPIVTKQEDLEDKIVAVDEWTDAADYKQMYTKFVERFNPYEDGNSTKRVVEKIFS